METRPCTIIKTYPQVLLGDHEITFTKDILTPTNESR